MGGKNHQPCREYLAISTRMSRYASLAFANLEMANVDLEDLLLTEMEGGIGNINGVKYRLEQSRQNISQLIDTARELRDEMGVRDEMGDRNYRDLLTMCSVDLDAIGMALIGAGMVDSTAWDEVVKNARSGGFYANLTMIHERALLLTEHTNKLIEQVVGLRAHAENGNVTSILEENLEGNLKPEFAKLYHAWTRFQELFIASSLLSTEVYYAFNGYGSLVDIAAQKSAA